MATKTTTKKIASATKVSKKAAPLSDMVVYNQSGKNTSTIVLPHAVFGLKWNADLVHQVAVSMLANKRASNAHAKDRSEVRGGGKKPWKQKGTGQARHGSSRSPIWVGGGVTFGPRNDKDYSKKINKKMRVKALFTVLSRRAHDGQILALDTLSLSAIKTKDAATILKSLSAISGFERLTSKKKTTALVVVAEKNDIIEKSFANLPGITIKAAKDLNVLDGINFNHVVLVNPEMVATALSAKIK